MAMDTCLFEFGMRLARFHPSIIRRFAAKISRNFPFLTFFSRSAILRAVHASSCLPISIFSRSFWFQFHFNYEQNVANLIFKIAMCALVFGVKIQPATTTIKQHAAACFINAFEVIWP